MNMTVQSTDQGSNFTLSTSLTERMKAVTKDLHREAERQPVMAEMVRGALSETKYIRYLVDHHYIYGALEKALPPVLHKKNIYFIEPLFRTSNFANDLKTMGVSLENSQPSVAAKSYVEHIKELERESSIGLLAHSYALHLALMFGGQIQKKGLSQQWPDACTFCDFPYLNIRQAADTVKDKLNAIPLSYEEQTIMIKEVVVVFEFIIDVLFSMEQKKEEVSTPASYYP